MFRDQLKQIERRFESDDEQTGFDQCVQRVLDRPDLTSYGRINTIEDADDFEALFEIVRKHMPPNWQRSYTQ